MDWQLQYGGESEGRWDYNVTYRGHSYFVKIRGTAPDSYDWTADRVTQRIILSQTGTLQRWAVINPQTHALQRLHFDSATESDSWVAALIEGEVDLPSDLSGTCICTTVDQARSQLEDRIRVDVAGTAG